MQRTLASSERREIADRIGVGPKVHALPIPARLLEVDRIGLEDLAKSRQVWWLVTLSGGPKFVARRPESSRQLAQALEGGRSASAKLVVASKSSSMKVNVQDELFEPLPSNPSSMLVEENREVFAFNQATDKK